MAPNIVNNSCVFYSCVSHYDVIIMYWRLNLKSTPKDQSVNVYINYDDVIIKIQMQIIMNAFRPLT